MIDRIKPLDPSSAPAVMSRLFSSAKPIATAARPAYELSIAMTVGISAPPIGTIRRMPNRSAMTMTTGNSSGAIGAAGLSASHVPIPIATSNSAMLTTFCNG